MVENLNIHLITRKEHRVEYNGAALALFNRSTCALRNDFFFFFFFYSSVPNASRMHMHLLYNVDWSISPHPCTTMLYLSCARMHRSFSGYQYIIFSDRKIYIIYLFQPNLGLVFVITFSLEYLTN